MSLAKHKKSTKKVKNTRLSFIKKIPFIKEFLVFICFVLVIAVFYGNTLANGFIHDDVGQIEQNKYVQSLEYFPKVVTGCIWESALGGCKGTTNYYRPTQSLSYLLTYQISSKPWIFHLINLIFFGIDSFLVFILIKLITKKRSVAFFAGLIFLIHPLSSSVANWIAAQPELLYGGFVMLTAIFHFLYRERNNPRYLIFVYIFYILGILSKEPAAFTPLLLLLFDLTYFRLKIRSLLTWQNIKPYLILGLIFAAYLAARVMVLGNLLADPVNTDSEILKLSIWQRILAYIDLLAMYIKKFALPYPMQFYYDAKPIFASIIANFAAILAGITYLGITFLAWKKRWMNIFFGLIWFLFFLSPNLIFLFVANTFAERYVFVSSVGLALIIALLLNRLWIYGQKGRISTIVLLAIISLSSWLMVFPWNKVWVDDFSIYNDTLKKNPNDDLIQYDLGVKYMNIGKDDLAKDLLTKVAQRGTWKGIYKAYNDLGDIYRRENNLPQARIYFAKAIESNPQHVPAYNNLGASYLSSGDTLDGIKYLCKAVQLNPNFTNAVNNLNFAINNLQQMDNQLFSSLYDQMLKGNFFKQSSKSDVFSFDSKNCSLPQGCIFFFSSKLANNQSILPYLILGKTSTNDVVRIRYFESDPKTNRIALGIDHQFEKQEIHFWIPTCDGEYFQTTVAVEK